MPAQPLGLLLQTLGSYNDPPIQFFQTLCSYFSCIDRVAGQVLWSQDERADGLYLIESGSLRATYAFENYPRLIQETMVAGTIAGDLSTLSDTTRNATAVVERDCRLWKMDQEALERLEKDHPDVARTFIRIVLKGQWFLVVSRCQRERLILQRWRKSRRCCRLI
jgi:SulP family sulfate permease